MAELMETKRSVNDLGVWGGALLLIGFGVLAFVMVYFGGFRIVGAPDVLLLTYTLGGGVLLILFSRMPASTARGLPLLAIGLAGVLIPAALAYAAAPGFFEGLTRAEGGSAPALQGLLILGGGVLLLGGARVVRAGGELRSAALTAKGLGGLMLALGLIFPLGGAGSVLIESMNIGAGLKTHGPWATIWFLAALLLLFAAMTALVGRGSRSAAVMTYIAALAGLTLPLVGVLVQVLEARGSTGGEYGELLVVFLMLACYVYPIIYALAGGVADITGPPAAENPY